MGGVGGGGVGWWLLAAFFSLACVASALKLRSISAEDGELPQIPLMPHSDGDAPGSIFATARQRQESTEGWQCTDPEGIKLARDTCTSYPFIECEWNEDRTPKCREGVFGYAVWAKLVNKPEETQVEIFANCRSSRANLTHPVFGEACRVGENYQQTIPVVIKLNKPEASSEGGQTTATELEIRRGRSFASRRYFDGTPLSPRWFDLRDVRTGGWHVLNENAFIMERLRGVTAQEVLLKAFNGEEMLVTSAFTALLTKFRAYAKATTQEERQKHLASLNKAAVRTVAEEWLRARYRLTIVDTVVAMMSQMAKQRIYHCDMHLANIMIMTSFTNSASDVVDHLYKGDAVFDPITLYWTESNVAEQLKLVNYWKEALKDGLPFWGLSSLQARLIDTAKGIDLTAKMDKKNNNANSLYVPCRIYRGQQVEDIVLFSRTLGIAARKLDPFSGNVLRRDLSAIWQEKMNSLAQTNDEDYRGITSDGQAEKQFNYVREGLKDIEGFFTDFESVIGQIPEYRECVRNAAEHSRQGHKLYHSQIKVSEAIRLESNNIFKCSVATMDEALAKVEKALKEQIDKFATKTPSFLVFWPSGDLETREEAAGTHSIKAPLSLVPMSLVAGVPGAQIRG